VLTIIPLADPIVDRLGRDYDVVYRPDGWSKVADQDKAEVRAVVTNGTRGFSRAQMEALPGLGLIGVFGAGYENVDVAAARARSIAVTHSPGVNDATAADHALALALALARDIPRRSQALRDGAWADIRGARPTLCDATAGIVGLGNIGAKIAQRVQAFDADVLYYDVAPRPNAAWTFISTVRELAAKSDFLFLACPGGPATRHLVNADVLASLGPKAFLINTARGSVVDTSALITALKARSIAGAALDVYETEPDIAPELLAQDNVVFTPHMAGRSPAALSEQTRLLLENLRAFSTSAPLASLVPELS
jgi:D-3-phosphoglycerate dehydrogenase